MKGNSRVPPLTTELPCASGRAGLSLLAKKMVHRRKTKDAKSRKLVSTKSELPVFLIFTGEEPSDRLKRHLST